MALSDLVVDGRHCGCPFIDTKLEGRIRQALAPGFTRSPSSSALAAARSSGSRLRTASAEWACRRHEIAWLAGPEDPASASKPAASTGWLRLGCTAQTKAPPEGRGSRHQTGLLARGLRERQQARHHNAEPQSWLHDRRHGGGGLAGTSTRIRVVG